MKFIKNIIFVRLITCCLITGLIALSCSKQEKKQSSVPSKNVFSLVIAQAQFKSVPGPDGKTKQQPGPALLTIKQKVSQRWTDIIIEDPQSNVFHKAIISPYSASEIEIITIGAMEASLKKWRFIRPGWEQHGLWNPVFGGKWDRLRDMEIGDITGDGRREIVIATHDQGVVAVAVNNGTEWKIEEIDREPGIFVHEVEVGDIDGDGKNEFFATPSKPNKAEGGPQSGQVVMYKWSGSKFNKTIVDHFEKTHAKEILVANFAGSSTATLFSVIEAETKVEESKVVRVEPVKIKKYVFNDKGISSAVIATIDDNQCRFLCAGDVDGDGKTELIASAMTSGIWLLREKNDRSWEVTLIDANSSGYEHATCLADSDGDGIEEIFVASDDQGELSQYKWNVKSFTKTLISPIPKGRITWNITAGLFK